MSVLADKGQLDSNTFERAIVMAGDKNESVVVIDADLARATQTDKFKAKYPDRYYDIGIAEQNLIGVAAGFALVWKDTVCGHVCNIHNQKVP